MKTLEFKLLLTTKQETVLTDWLDYLPRLWNRALSLLEEDQQRRWREKNGFDPQEGREKWIFYRNPERWPWQAEDEQCAAAGKYGLACQLYRYDYQREEAYQCVNIREHLEVESPWKEAERIATHQAYPEGHKIRSICTRVLTDIVRNRLQKAWKAYRDPKHPGRRPKYKGKRDRVDSIANCDGSVKKAFKIDGDRATIPYLSNKAGLGSFKAKGLGKRWPSGLPVKQYRICRKADGWYLQLVGDVPSTLKAPKLPDVAVGVDPGVVHALNLSNGKHYDAPKPYAKLKRRLARMQRQASRRTVGGANWKKSQQRIAKLHGKIARVRRSWSHKVTTLLATTYGKVAYEKNTYRNMVRRPKAKKRQNGDGYEQTGAKRKSGLARSLTDVAGYQTRELLETKCQVTGSEFVEVSAPYNSQTCSQCGNIDKNSRLSQSEFCCTSCGHHENADINAARVVFKKAFADSDSLSMRESADVQASDRKDTPLPYRGNRRTVVVGSTKTASEGETPCQRLLTVQSSDFDPRTAQPGDYSATHPVRGKRKRSKNDRSAQVVSEVPMQLEIWDSAPAEHPDSS